MKKPTNRIRQNGSTKAVKSQAKTAAQENVTFVVTCKETGELAAKFDVPRPFLDAMMCDTLRRGISLQQWVENAVRERMCPRKAKAVETVLDVLDGITDEMFDKFNSKRQARSAA